VADDDTRYRIVQRRRTPTREGADAGGGERRARARRNTAPAAPSAIANGTAPSAQRLKRTAVDTQDDEVSVVMMPRVFGGTEIVVEDHGDHIAIVFPGALRLVGTRDEAVALAAALLHTVERQR
jgi:hypothetical protein